MGRSFVCAYLRTNDLSNTQRVRRLYNEVNMLKMLNTILVDNGYAPCNTSKMAADACFSRGLITQEYYKKLC